MTQDELHELIPNITTVLPHVDSITVIDGGSQGNAVTYMRNWSQEEPKIRYFINPWENSFPKQRNQYLKRVSEIAQPGDYILATDPDEYIESSSLEKMRDYIKIAEQHQMNMIGFQCRSVSLKGTKRTWENMDNFWKRFLIKWNPSMQYAASGTGTVHEHLTGFVQRIWDPGTGDSKQEPLIYEHRKQENDIWRKGFRNLVHGGGGPNGVHAYIHYWHELLEIMKSLSLSGWHDLYKYMLKGNIDQRLKDWMISCKDLKGWDGASEHREAYKYYFRQIHPEEEPVEFRNEHIE